MEPEASRIKMTSERAAEDAARLGRAEKKSREKRPTKSVPFCEIFMVILRFETVSIQDFDLVEGSEVVEKQVYRKETTVKMALLVKLSG
jgi:hypothetical protein